MGFIACQGQDISFFSTDFGRTQYFSQGVHRLWVWPQNVFVCFVSFWE